MDCREFRLRSQYIEGGYEKLDEGTSANVERRFLLEEKERKAKIEFEQAKERLESVRRDMGFNDEMLEEYNKAGAGPDRGADRR
jgi:hypothetical protein